MQKKIFFLLFINTFFIIKAQTTRTVTSETEFNSALNSSSSGDIIEWANGTYSDVYMDVDVSGVTVKAATSGGVIFNGASRVLLDVSNITFTGFQFIGGDIYNESGGTIENTVITVDGSNVLVSHINISEYTCKKYFRLRDSSQNSEVTYCNFEKRTNYADQNIFQVDVSSSKAGYHNINHCSFKDFSGETTGGDDGVEPIRIGASSQAAYSSKSIIEYCYFTGCDGDGEIISHKASDCVYRYNTFENNTKAELVLRHGDGGIVYGNFFINGMGGVRIQEGSNHVVYNNYFSGLTSRSLNLNASSADKLDNILIAYNTFVDSDVVDIESHSTDEATNITIANNVFSNPSSSDGLFEDVTGDETWIGNIANGDLGEANSSNFTVVDPEYSLNTEGFYTIASTSPVINKGQTGYTALPVFTDLDYDNEIVLDVMGSSRPTTEAMKDVGCEEYNSSVALKAHVSSENTGPDYLMENGSLSISSEELLEDSFIIYPNPIVDNTVKFNFSLKEESNVKVDVYDLSGKRIINLIDESYSRGDHLLNSTVNLEAGFYLINIQISAGGTVVTKTEKIVKQ